MSSNPSSNTIRTDHFRIDGPRTHRNASVRLHQLRTHLVRVGGPHVHGEVAKLVSIKKSLFESTKHQLFEPIIGALFEPICEASFESTGSTSHVDVSSIGSNAPRYIEPKRSTRSEDRIGSKFALHVTTRARATIGLNGWFRTKQPRNGSHLESIISLNPLIQMPRNFHRSLHSCRGVSMPNFTLIG